MENASFRFLGSVKKMKWQLWTQVDFFGSETHSYLNIKNLCFTGEASAGFIPLVPIFVSLKRKKQPLNWPEILRFGNSKHDI